MMNMAVVRVLLFVMHGYIFGWVTFIEQCNNYGVDYGQTNGSRNDGCRDRKGHAWRNVSTKKPVMIRAAAM